MCFMCDLDLTFSSQKIGWSIPHHNFSPWGMGKNEEWKKIPMGNGENWGITKGLEKIDFLLILNVYFLSFSS